MCPLLFLEHLGSLWTLNTTITAEYTTVRAPEMFSFFNLYQFTTLCSVLGHNLTFCLTLCVLSVLIEE